MEDIIDIIVTETTNLIEITSQPTDEIIDVNIIDNREDVTLNVTPTLVEININSLTGNFGVNWGEIAGTLLNQTDLQNALNLKADLVDGKVPSSQLPSYVDDVVEVANYAALPVTGEVGKIYITLDTNFIYRWTGSTYVEIKDSSAVWGAITGTLSNQTDLQNALNAKANDNAVVHLAGTETITGAKTFSSAVIAPNFVLSGGTGNTGLYYGHTDRVVLANYTAGGIDFEVNGGSIVATLFPSGNYGLGIALDAGYKLDVNGTTRISGALSGTSASFSSSITAASIIKSGGTSSQFLKADGSVDSTSYQPLLTNPVTGTGTSGIVAVFNGTSSITDSTIYANSTRVSIGADVTTTNRFTAVSSTTSAYAVVAQASSAAHGIWSNVLGTGEIFRGQTAGGSYFIINNGGNAFLNGNLNVGDFASTSYRLNVVGTANFTGALSGTSATFSGDITIGTIGNSSSAYHRGSFNGTNTSANLSAVYFSGGDGSQNRGGLKVYQTWGGTYTDTCVDLFVTKGGVGGTTALSINGLGAATFSSSVTATGGLTVGSLGSGSDAIISLANNASGSPRTIYYKASTATINFTSTGGGDLVTITNGGNVGIGTTSPSERLDIAGNALLNGDGTWIKYSGANAFFGSASTISGGSVAQLGIRSGSEILFATNGTTERMRITSGGNVAINGTGAGEKLNITSGNQKFYTYQNSAGQYTYIGTEYAQGNGNNKAEIRFGIESDTYTNLSFHTANGFGTLGERMRITSSGSVGIGTTSPSATLHVVGSQLFDGVGATFKRTGVLSGQNWNLGIDNSGLSFYDNTNGAYRLTIGPTGALISPFTYSNTTANSANIYMGSTGTFERSTSSLKYKTNVRNYDKGIDIVSQMRPVYYEGIGINDSGKVFAGLIAEEIHDLGLTEFVQYAEDGTPDALAYQNMVSLLIKGMQELKAELDTLKNK